MIDPLRDPLIRRMMGMPRPMSITEPWMAVAEQRLMAAIYQGSPEPSLRSLGLTIEHAHTYLWKFDIIQMAADYPIPDHVVADSVMPFDAMYFSFEDAVDALNDQGDKIGITDWFLLLRGPRGVNIYWNLENDNRADGAIDSRGPQIGSGTVAYGPFHSDGSQSFGDMAIAMLAFLASDYVGKEQRRLPRQMRRHDLAAHSVLRDTLVHVVTLRQAVREAVTRDGPGRSLDEIRWWVRGHLRAQWYPSESAHHLVWIAPYLKGPEDAPLRPHVRHVIR
jgi:hypothetical protein